MAGQTGGQRSQTFLTPKYILSWFSPRWFIFVMGTAAMANVYEMLAGGPTGMLHNAAVVFLLAAIVVFAIAGVFMMIRPLVCGECILKEFRHASLIQFYSTVSIAAAVCATGLLRIPIAFLSETAAVTLSIVFWRIAAAVGIFFLFFTPFQVIIGNHAQPRRALGFWFLPPVGLFVLVFAGNFLGMRIESMGYSRALFLANTFVLGTALCLTVILFTIFLFRALFWNFPRRDVAPSFAIGVAPIGVCIVAINTYLPFLKKVALPHMISAGTLEPFVKLFSLFLWGFGLWWLVVAVAIISLYFLKQGVPVTLGYWAFIFPPAAYTISSLLLADRMAIPFIREVGVVLAIALSLIWGVNLILTVRGMANRTIFDVSPTFKGDIPYL